MGVMVKVTDFLSEQLILSGINTSYAVTGGAVVHILDSYKKMGGKVIFFHHEQSASFAVSAHQKASGETACCIVTSGPGVTNAITGLAGAWMDSIPAIFISGQSRIASLVGKKKGIRQRGNQEVVTEKLVESICKKFYMPSSVEDIPKMLQEAISIAHSGRPGPVWIDLPLDLQWSEIDKRTNKKYSLELNKTNNLDLSKLLNKIYFSKKPIIILGMGVKLSKAQEELRKTLKKLKVPVLTTWAAIGVIDENSPFHAGRPGPGGNRSSNKLVMESDLIIAIGTHLRSQVLGPNSSTDLKGKDIFAIHLDHDEAKYSNVKDVDFICSDAKEFLRILDRDLEIPLETYETWKTWNNYASKIKKYNLYKSQIDRQPGKVDPYDLLKYVSENFYGKCNYVIDGGGTVTQMSMQDLNVAQDQNIILSTAITPMGTGLPEAVGASIASSKSVILFVGEGSFQFNIQELATIKYHKLPIIIIVIDNGGYLSIKNTQKQFLDSNYLGVDNNSGLEFPRLSNIAKAYSTNYLKITDNNQFSLINEAFEKKDSTIIEVLSNTNREVEPRIAFRYSETEGKNFSLPLSDMDPEIDMSDAQYVRNNF